MTDSKTRVLNRERQRGYEAAKAVQTHADSMTGTELYAVDDRIPSFTAALAKMNMLEGRVVRLLQVYDSDIYPQEPEELPAQWGFKWSTDPQKALPFIAISTSPYNTGECCSVDGTVYRSTMDNNVWNPLDYHSGWEDVQT